MPHRSPTIPEDPRYRGLRGVSNAVVIVCVTAFAIVVVVCGALLSYLNRDPEAFTRVINTLLNWGSFGLSGGAMLYASSASNKSGKAVEQTNGSLDQRIREALRAEREDE